MATSILFLPLLGFLFCFLLGKQFNYRVYQISTTSILFLCTLFSWIIFIQFINNKETEIIFILNWITSGNFIVDWSIRLDTLTAVMFIVVTTVSACVHLYSIGYMEEDPSKIRFMGYLSLFTFFMLVLVSSNNLLQMFFGWEGVGLASYLLIGFWHHKDSANKAAIKAFVVNRVGDFGYAIGIAGIFYIFGTISFDSIFSQVDRFSEHQIQFLSFSFPTLDFLCFLLFIGAMGKSAQLGLHTWLPDAMEGPTPVSALIHAATMVTAGVFLVARMSPLYEFATFTNLFITFIGAATAIFAASIALTQNDIKRVIAYSTCSQLGYMFFAAGVGAYNVAMFHLFTHAFFKALLFLGSGSVIHSFKDEQDVTKMGGVFKKLPYTYVLMVVGTLALTGFPFLSGFYSKDAIIEFAYISETKFGIYAAGIGVLTAVMTSIYSWRLIFKTFHGDYKNKDLSIDTMHESPLSMMLPLVLLAVGAVFSGFLFKELFIGHETMYSFWGESIKFLEPLGKEHPPTWFLFLTPTLVVLTIPLSYYLFVKNTKIVNEIVSINMPVYIFLKKKWYFDELYDQIFIKPSKSFGIFLWKKIDGLIIDKFGPDGISNFVKLFSFKAVKFQSGYIYQYAFIMLLGFSILLTLLIVK